MKRILKILAIVVGVLIVIAIAIPFFVDANTFRPKLESELTDALGTPREGGEFNPVVVFGWGVVRTIFPSPTTRISASLLSCRPSR